MKKLDIKMQRTASQNIARWSNYLQQLLKSRAYVIEEIHNAYKARDWNAPHNVPGVYVILDQNDNVVWVGKTTRKSILDRVGNQHVYGNAPSDLRILLRKPSISDILQYKCKYIAVVNARERSMIEHFLIAALWPEFNK